MKSKWSFLRTLALVHLVVSVSTTSVWAQTEDVPTSSVSIHAVRYHVEPGRTRVWFETSGTVLYTQYSPDPLTLVVDLPGVDVSSIAERTVVGSREVESILVNRLEGVNGKTLSRIEIKLGSLVPYQISASQHTLTIVFEGADAEEVPPAAAVEPPQVTREDTGTLAASDESITSTSLAEPTSSGDTAEQSVAEEPSEEGSAQPDWSSYPPASFIQSVVHSVDGDVLKVVVEADGRMNYSSFRLENPSRLVFDFNGVTNRVSRATLPIGAIGVGQVRIAQFRAASPESRGSYSTSTGTCLTERSRRVTRLRILFASTDEILARSLPVPTQVASDARDDMVLLVPAEDSMSGGGNGSHFMMQAEEVGLDTPSGSGLSIGMSDSAHLAPVAVVAQSALSELPEGSSVPLLPTPPQDTTPTEQMPSLLRNFEGTTIGAEERTYTGELISLDFKDGDIQDIFRLFADISGLNIVVQPGVTGRITLKLTEVPWDQALDLILKTHKLGYVVEGNVVRLAPLSELADEEAERRRLAEEKALAGDLSLSPSSFPTRRPEPYKLCCGETSRPAARSRSMNGPIRSSSPTWRIVW